MATCLWMDLAERQEERVTFERGEYTLYYKAQITGDFGLVFAIIKAFPQFTPGVGTYPADRTSFVQTVNPVRIEGTDGLYDVQIDYSTDRPTVDTTNPLAQPPSVKGTSVDRTRVRLRDNQDKPVLNTAGDLMDDPPPEIEESDLIWNVEKKVSVRLPAWINDYRNAVNSDAVVIRGLPYDPFTLKVKGMEIDDPDEQNGIPFCIIRFQVHHREDGWTYVVPNRGYYELVPRNEIRTESGKIVTVVSGGGLKVGKNSLQRREIKIDGERPTEPQMLDAKGRWIEKPTAENIVMLEFDFSRLKPFTGVLPLK